MDLERSKARHYIKLSDLLVNLEFAPTKAFAEKLISERRVRVCGELATSGDMTVASDESDIILGPKHIGNLAATSHVPAPYVVSGSKNVWLDTRNPGDITQDNHTIKPISQKLAKNVKVTPSTSAFPTISVDDELAKAQFSKPIFGSKTFLGEKQISVESPLTLEASLLKAYSGLNLTSAQASSLIQARTVTVNGVVATNPSQLVTNVHDVKFVPDVPVWRWLIFLEGLNVTDAFELIRVGRVAIGSTQITDSNQPVSPTSVRSIRILTPSLAKLFVQANSSEKPSNWIDVVDIPKPTVRVSELLVWKGLSPAFAHARWLCSNKRIVTSDGTLLEDPDQTVDDLNAGIIVVPRSLEIEKSSVFRQYLANLTEKAVHPFKSLVQPPLETLDDVIIAICEYGEEFGIAYDRRVGAAFRIPARLASDEGLPRSEASSVRSSGISAETTTPTRATMSENEAQAEDSFAEEAPIQSGLLAANEEEEKGKGIEAGVTNNDPVPLSTSRSVAVGDISISKASQDSRVPKEKREQSPRIGENVELIPLHQALVAVKIAIDAADAHDLCAAGAVIVKGEVCTSGDAVVSAHEMDIKLDNDVQNMRRVIPRCTVKRQDVFTWPEPGQRDLLWSLAGVSCLVCNVAVEAYACGAAPNPSQAVALFSEGGVIPASSKVAAAILKGTSRVILQRACEDAWTRWTDPAAAMPYRRQARRQGEFFVGPQSEYFWPLLGVYREESTIVEFLNGFFIGETDANKRMKSLAVLLDFVLYVSDDSFLIQQGNRAETSQAHQDRLRNLSTSPGLNDGVWGHAFRALLNTLH